MKYLITVISLSILFSCVQDSPNIQQIENLQFFIDNKENADVIEVEKGLQYSVIKSGNSSGCLLYTSPSPRDRISSRMPSSA